MVTLRHDDHFSLLSADLCRRGLYWGLNVTDKDINLHIDPPPLPSVKFLQKCLHLSHRPLPISRPTGTLCFRTLSKSIAIRRSISLCLSLLSGAFGICPERKERRESEKRDNRITISPLTKKPFQPFIHSASSQPSSHEKKGYGSECHAFVTLPSPLRSP